MAFIHVPRTGGSSFYNEQLQICSHSIGHGTVSDYYGLDHDHRFFTIMRDPLDICISYYYTMKVNDNIYEFLENSDKRLYSYYFQDKDINNFDIVGNFAEIGKTFALINSMLSVSVPYRHVNNGTYEKSSIKYNIKKFISDHEEEYDIYHRGLNRYKNLCDYHL